MKFRLSIPLISLIVLFSLSLTFPILHVYAAPDNETLWVNSYTAITQEWTETGASPFLSDSDTNYINTKTDAYTHEEFGFANSGVGEGTINSVYIWIQMQGSSARNDYVEIFVWDGTTWNEEASQDVDADSYQYYNYDISTNIDTWAKIDSAKLYVVYQKSGSPATVDIYIRRCYLYIDYTPSGNDYDVYPTNTLGFSFSTSRLAEFSRDVTGTLGFTYATSRLAEFSRDVTNTLGFTFATVGLWGTKVFPTLALGFSATTSRLAEFSRDVTNTLGFTFSTSRLAEFSRDVVNTLGFTFSTVANWGKQVYPTLGLGFSATTSRLAEFSRGVSNSLGFTLDSLIESVVAGVGLTPGHVLAMFGVLAMAICPLLIILVFRRRR